MRGEKTRLFVHYNHFFYFRLNIPEKEFVY
jgi:hypothetical protein